MMSANLFPGFNYPADSVAKFLCAADFFTMMLKDGSIIHYTATDAEAFKQWLVDNTVMNIKEEIC